MNTRAQYLSCLKASACAGRAAGPVKESIRRRLMNWILYREYWNSDDSIDRMADELRIPKAEIIEFLADSTGNKYITLRKELRMQDAAEMLVEKPEISIYEVARRVGMTDKSNFRREFEEHTGLKPTDWRECRGSLRKYWINSLKVRAENHFPSPHKNT